MTASLLHSLKKKSKKNKANFVKIEFEVHNLTLLPTFMVNFGHPYNDLVICKDSTDYLHLCQK